MGIDTSIYFYAAYAVFWLLPTLFVIKTFADIKSLDAKLSAAEARVQ